MTVIKHRTLLFFAEGYSDAKEPLNAWYKMIKQKQYRDIIELRSDFPSADAVAGGKLVCFNIKGNRYRLIVRVTWGKTIFIRDFLTHAEYSRKYRGK